MTDAISLAQAARRPRFRRAAEPPPFRLTDGDVAIIHQIAKHRVLRSTHVAALIGRSLDRTNDRLLRLFHAGYIDRPRAQLDYYPTSGSAPMVYALADDGVRLLTVRGAIQARHLDWSRKNREAGRQFIEHQLEIADFYVALELTVRDRSDIRLIHSDELIAAFPEETRRARNPIALRVSMSRDGNAQEIGLIPDLIFGIGFRDGSKRCFMVEIDRGTMPISRSDETQTSYARKMRAYLDAHVAREHERRFGWRTFRVLTVTTDLHRFRSMREVLRRIEARMSPAPSLFFFALKDELHNSDPLAHIWHDGAGREVRLV